MYEDFFHLSSMPFSLLPDADFLYPSKRHLKAINHLEYGIFSKAGFIVITGEVGAGKTTVLRRYIKTASPDVCIGIITNPNPTFGSLLNWVSQAFDISSTPKDGAAIYQEFVSFLVAQYATGKRCILIIDEAQNLDVGMLEELRMLSNVNNEKDQLLQIILVGQPELLDILKQNHLRQFVQRISVHCHLDALSAKETAAYIRHRLGIAGGSPELFTDEACAAVHYFSGGVPRLINLLCDQSLVYAFSDDQPTISGQTVLEVVEDRNQSGLSPFQTPPKGSPAALQTELHGIMAQQRQ